MTFLWIYNMPLVPEAGGTERITSLIAKGLASRGHRCLGILVFRESDHTMTYDGKPVADLYGFLSDNKVDIVINQIAYSRWLLEAFLAAGGSRWRTAGGRIISCLHFDPCNPSVIQLLKSQDNWKISDYIKYIKFNVFANHYKNRQQYSEGQIYNYIYNNSDIFVSLSSTHFDYLKKVMKRNEYSRLHSIGNPLTFDIELTEEQLHDKRNTILICARMSEYHKRISLALKAWEKIRKRNSIEGWILKIIGDGPDLERYKRYAATHNLTNIEFLGQQDPEPHYREARILLLTSSAEGWGLTLTEALQFGVVPVVLNSSSVYKEIITHQFDGLLTPDNNIGLFSQAIELLINDSRRLNTMQRNALKSSKKFTLDKTIDKWETLLNRI